MPVRFTKRIIKSNPFTAQAYDSGGLNFKDIGNQLDKNNAAKKQAPIDSLKVAEEALADASVTNKGKTETLINEYREWISATHRGIAKTDKNGQTKKNSKGEVKFRSGNLNSPENRLKNAEWQLKLTKTIQNGKRLNETFQQAYKNIPNLPPEIDKAKYQQGIANAINGDHDNYDPEWEKNLMREAYSFDDDLKEEETNARSTSLSNQKSDGTWSTITDKEYNPDLIREEGGKFIAEVADGYYKTLMSKELFAEEITGRAKTRYDLIQEEINAGREETLTEADAEFHNMSPTDRNKATIVEAFNAHESSKITKQSQVRKQQTSVTNQKYQQSKLDQKEQAEWVLSQNPMVFEYLTTKMVENIAYTKDGKGIAVSMKTGADGKFSAAYTKVIPIRQNTLAGALSAMEGVKAITGKKAKDYTSMEELEEERSIIEKENNDPLKIIKP